MQVTIIAASLFGNIIATVNPIEPNNATGIKIFKVVTWYSVPSMNNDKIREHTKPDAIIADEQIDEANVFEYP